jgi:hypothetical protein
VQINRVCSIAHEGQVGTDIDRSICRFGIQVRTSSGKRQARGPLRAVHLFQAASTRADTNGKAPPRIATGAASLRESGRSGRDPLRRSRGLARRPTCATPKPQSEHRLRDAGCRGISLRSSPGRKRAGSLLYLTDCQKGETGAGFESNGCVDEDEHRMQHPMRIRFAPETLSLLALVAANLMFGAVLFYAAASLRANVGVV